MASVLPPSNSGRPWVPWVAGAAVATAAAAVGAATGLISERAVVRRSVRRGGRSAGISNLGQVRAAPRIVEASDGLQLYCEVDDVEQASAPTVVFVHGYALNLDCWHYQRLGLRGMARLVLYDQRSHGRSGRDLGANEGEAPLMTRLADDLKQVLEDVAAPEQVVLIGHSMGGMTIMALASDHPDYFRDKVSGVGLIATSAGGLSEVTLGVPPLMARALRPVVPHLVSAAGRNAMLVERGRQVTNDLAVLLTRRYAFGGPAPIELSQFTLEMINATPVEVLAQFYPEFIEYDGGKGLAVIDGIEALVVVGAQDKMTPPDHSRRIVQRVPGAELVVLDPGGHLVMLERPDDVNADLFALLSRANR